MAVHADAALGIAAEAVVRPRRVEVVGHEQIQVAVAVHVDERAAGAPAGGPTLAARVTSAKTPVAGVAVQLVGAVVGDVQVHAPVVVYPRRRRTHPGRTLDVMPDAAVTSAKARAKVAEEPMAGARARLTVALARRASIHQEQIDPAVRVVVEEHGA